MVIGILKGIFSALVVIFGVVVLVSIIAVGLLMLGLWIDKKNES